MSISWNSVRERVSDTFEGARKVITMNGIMRLTMALAVLALAGPALAQDGGEEPAPLAERTIDFSDEIVEGELVRPDGEFIEGMQGRGSTSLIDIREHFIDKMIQSAEDL